MNTDTISTAQAAADTLHGVLASGTAARQAVMVKHYGKGTTPAHVALAEATARVLAGEVKPRGGKGQRINDVLGSVNPESTPADYVAAARAVMEAHAAAQAKRRADAAAERAQLKQTLNDRGESSGTRRSAFDAIVALDYAQGADKRAAALEGFKSAMVRALAAGVSHDALAEMVASAAPAPLDALTTI